MTSSISNIDKINEYFKIPISFTKQPLTLNRRIVEDLELIHVFDPSSSTPIYQHTYQPKTSLGKKVLEQYPGLYTTDVRFLKDTQKLLKTYKPYTEPEPYEKDVVSSINNEEEVLQIWDEIKNDTGFKDRYHYIDWPMWEFINNSESMLQAVSMYNLASPLLSLLVPVFIFIIPFFIIKIKGVDITFLEYKKLLIQISANHSIGKLFSNFGSAKLEEKVYLIVTSAFYLFSIYQNILTCIRFNNNMTKIHSYFGIIQRYIQHTENNGNRFLKYSKKFESYSTFNGILETKLSFLGKIKNTLKTITPYNDIKCCQINQWFNKIKQFGLVLKQFYDIYSNETYNEAFLYSFGFNGYIDTLEGLLHHIDCKNIQFATFSKNKKGVNKLVFKKSYHPSLVNKTPIKNNINLSNHLVITGPNASGKTTVLKTSIINLILTQQIGCGFYENVKLSPFKYIHCYLNIPDTSGRDSLFQAEARRCKTIIDCIVENDKDKDSHFCAFDELYSGTNPDEAVSSAYAFMMYLNKFPKVTCILTTHFIELCKHLESSSSTSFKNFHMETKLKKDNCENTNSIYKNNDFEYTYLLKPEISTISGGVKVLYDMNYPEEIIINSLLKK